MVLRANLVALKVLASSGTVSAEADAAAATTIGSRDEDGNPRRVGSLARDQPTSPPIETLRHRSGLLRHARIEVRERRRGSGRVEAGRGNTLEG
jgi:hypothetical protein